MQNPALYKKISVEQKREEIKQLIQSANSHFVTVDFVKKDGTLRTMKIQNAMLKYNLVGESASESAKRAVETRKANNPHLYSVYDFDKNEIRSINLDTVTRIKTEGKTYEYETGNN